MTPYQSLRAQLPRATGKSAAVLLGTSTMILDSSILQRPMILAYILVYSNPIKPWVM
jgi:hypothetical protein